MLKYFVCFLLLFITACNNTSDSFFELRSNKPFEKIMEDAEFAITEYNFRIVNKLHIGQAISDRNNSYFPENEIFLFCNLTITEKILNIDPNNIIYCPYRVIIYENNNSFIVKTQLLTQDNNAAENNKLIKSVNDTLRSIVSYAAMDDHTILEK